MKEKREALRSRMQIQMGGGEETYEFWVLPSPTNAIISTMD